ncbi:MAG: galactosyldiacylglycerol synthase [Acidobacteria bacterium]|jgi:processive 1,2-diacylglycerol beta-glucosyltransferase|nr:galactosyldiacylglycerol synthase [Acidobacteriota bacterium]
MSHIQLFAVQPDNRERKLLGTITEADLDFLIDNLEEEFEEDDDYFLNRDTLDYLEGKGIDAELAALLRTALDENPDGVDILYIYG